MHQEDGAGSLQSPRGVVESEHALHGTRDEARLAVQKQEGDDPHERRQHGRQRDQRAEHAPTGELQTLEQERQGHADRFAHEWHDRCSNREIAAQAGANLPSHEVADRSHPIRTPVP